jgi:hemoglobin-like flavoprotein
MTVTQAYLVRRTFAILEQHREVAALVFYRRLFELDPRLRPLFKSDITEQARKLMDMLGVLVTQLDRPAALSAELREMGARHAGYGVQDAHYATVRAALLDMLGQTLGDGFTPEAAEAWGALYTEVETSMKLGAREADLSPA